MSGKTNTSKTTAGGASAPPAASQASSSAAAAGTATTDGSGALPDGASEARGTVEALANSGRETQKAVMESGQAAALGSALTGVKPALRVISRPETFRRAGREFSREAVTIPAEELTEDQLEALENEPELVTTRVYLTADGSEE